MSRSMRKGPYVDSSLLAKVLKQKQAKASSAIKTWARASQIAPEFIGHTFMVYNGKRFVEVYVSESMVGHRFGEFALTRTFKTHGRVTKRIMAKT